jgi:hypothetical protein
MLLDDGACYVAKVCHFPVIHLDEDGMLQVRLYTEYLVAGVIDRVHGSPNDMLGIVLAHLYHPPSHDLRVFEIGHVGKRLAADENCTEWVGRGGGLSLVPTVAADRTGKIAVHLLMLGMVRKRGNAEQLTEYPQVLWKRVDVEHGWYETWDDQRGTCLRFGGDWGGSHGNDGLGLGAKLTCSKMEFVVLPGLMCLIDDEE